MTTNALLTPSLITKETLVILENNLVAAGKVNRQFENQFVKIGNSITVRKPNRFLVTTGPGLVLQNISEPSTSLTISTQNHVDFQFSSADLTLTIEEFSERYLKPAAAALQKLHEERTDNSAEFRYLHDDIAALDAMRSQKTLSLNLKTREAERKRQEHDRLERENALRAAHDEKPVKSLEEIKDDPAAGILLDEAAQIAADYSVLLTRAPKPTQQARRTDAH